MIQYVFLNIFWLTYLLSLLLAIINSQLTPKFTSFLRIKCALYLIDLLSMFELNSLITMNMNMPAPTWIWIGFGVCVRFRLGLRFRLSHRIGSLKEKPHLLRSNKYIYIYLVLLSTYSQSTEKHNAKQNVDELHSVKLSQCDCLAFCADCASIYTNPIYTHIPNELCVSQYLL